MSNLMKALNQQVKWEINLRYLKNLLVYLFIEPLKLEKPQLIIKRQCKNYLEQEATEEMVALMLILTVSLKIVNCLI